MICPVELASDVSALQAARVGDHAEHGFLHEGGDGAGDESTGGTLTAICDPTLAKRLRW